MEWTPDKIDRLYVLYQRHLDRLRADVCAANRSLGSSNPDRTNLDDLTRAEFEVVLDDPKADPEATCLWIKRIIRGHEHEFIGFDENVSRRSRRTGS